MFQFISPAAPETAPVTSNILGATGLPREALKETFRCDGLFGADSDLSAIEQAAVQAQLDPIPGITQRRFGVVTAAEEQRLSKLAWFTACVLRAQGEVHDEMHQALLSAGFSRAALSEVITIMRNVRVVFGQRAATRSEPGCAANLRVSAARAA